MATDLCLSLRILNNFFHTFIALSDLLMQFSCLLTMIRQQPCFCLFQRFWMCKKQLCRIANKYPRQLLSSSSIMSIGSSQVRSLSFDWAQHHAHEQGPKFSMGRRILSPAAEIVYFCWISVFPWNLAEFSTGRWLDTIGHLISDAIINSDALYLTNNNIAIHWLCFFNSCSLIDRLKIDRCLIIWTSIFVSESSICCNKRLSCKSCSVVHK